MAMILLQLIPEKFFNIPIGLSPVCFYVFRTVVKEWIDKYTIWSSYPAKAMTTARDNCRSVLSDTMGITISKDSSTHVIFEHFIVPELTQWQFGLTSECQSTACKTANKEGKINTTGVRTYTVSVLNVDPKLLKNSDTQNVINQLVYPFH